MHEASELVQVTAPLASAGGLAAIVGLISAAGARRRRSMIPSSSARDATRTPAADRNK